MPLSATQCREAKPAAQPYKLFDGQGLYLLTQPNGRKYWRLKYRFAGREKLLALGVWPAVTLEAARRGAAQARGLLRQDSDPAAERRAAKLAPPPAGRAALTRRTHSISIAHDLFAHHSKSRRTAPLAQMPGLDGHLCFALYAASNHMTRLFVPFLKTLGVTYPQYLVMVALWEQGDHGAGELASALDMDFGTLSPMLQRLEQKGLIARTRHAVDQRRLVVSLTPAGKALRKRTQQMLGEFYCFLNVPLDELVDLKDRLRRFVRTAGPVTALPPAAHVATPSG